MKGDFTRRTFNPQKHYSSVRMQQGRVQLDADWNEQVDIDLYTQRMLIRDTIGRTGVPIESPGGFALGFERNPTPRVFVSPGRIYVDGILCELEKEIDLNEQPDFPETLDVQRLVEFQSNNQLVNLLYLEVWEREITAFEDPSIVEVALGGADTALRTKVVWQIKTHAFQPQEFGEDPITTQALRITPDGRFQPLDPLDVAFDETEPPEGNQLYRVEIHEASTGDDAAGATFKWSRDNGSIVAAWRGGTGTSNDLAIIAGRTPVREGQFLEFTHDALELLGRPGILRKIVLVRESSPGVQRVEVDDASGIAELLNAFVDDAPNNRFRKVRIWDSAATPVQGTSVDRPLVGGGVRVRFPNNKYRTGDAWSFPVRQKSIPAKAESAVERRRFARLGVLIAGDGGAVINDMRAQFIPLAELDQRSGSADTAFQTTLSNLTAALQRRRHYHGQADIDRNMPLVVHVHMEDSSYVPQKVKLFIRGQQFSQAFYTEMGNHLHSSQGVEVSFAHNHVGTASFVADHVHSIRIQDPAVANEVNHGNGVGTGFAFRGIIAGAGGHVHGLEVQNSLGPYRPIVNVQPFGATISAGTETKFFLNNLRIRFDGRDVTDQLISKLAGWNNVAGDGTANHPLVRTGSGVLDVTALLPTTVGTHEIRFEVANGGGKLLYDIFCE